MDVLQLVHHHPGRLRVRCAAFRGAARELDAIRAALAAIPAVRRVAHDARTGSLLVEYLPGDVEPDAVVTAIAVAAGAVVDTPDWVAARRRGAGALRVIEGARAFNARVHELTGYRAEPRALVPLALAGLAAVSFVVRGGERWPRWDNLVWWSYSLFTQLYRSEIGRHERDLRGPRDPARPGAGEGNGDEARGGEPTM